MGNPYRLRSEYSFWKQAVSDQAKIGIDPIVRAPFRISRSDSVATAGSCFAQHISRTLVSQGFHYLVTEKYARHAGTVDESYGVFPARFANIYTSRQLVQLFDRAYGLFHPAAEWWVGKGGRYIDPFRPRVQADGFESVDALVADRKRHLASVRTMFESCQVFIFTLGLTETWLWNADGAAFPLAPGVVSPNVPDEDYRFENLSVADVIADMNNFLEKLRMVNSQVKIILTVSPVPLIATFEDQHVLVSTIASKSILRAAVDEVCRAHPEIAYFPSYEIITGPQTGARFYEPDLREVTQEGVAYVMSLFGKHYLTGATAPASGADTTTACDSARTGLQVSRVETAVGEVPRADELQQSDDARFAQISKIICDEEEIVASRS